MNKLWQQTVGEGDYNLVMLHGWGLNAEIWHSISKELIPYFTLYLVDLPGFGRSRSFSAMPIEDMAEYVLQNTPSKAIWLGWSLGGLIASQIAIMHPERVQALITVASSPCFITQKSWPGIKLETLASFQQQLNKDFQSTIKRFLVMQTLGTGNMLHNLHNLHALKSAILPIADNKVLNGGLEILKKSDLREQLAKLIVPHLRIYGYFDSLVPRKIVTLLDSYWPQSKSLIIKNAAHAPFLSCPKEFCSAIINLSRCLI